MASGIRGIRVQSSPSVRHRPSSRTADDGRRIRHRGSVRPPLVLSCASDRSAILSFFIFNTLPPDAFFSRAPTFPLLGLSRPPSFAGNNIRASQPRSPLSRGDSSPSSHPGTVRNCTPQERGSETSCNGNTWPAKRLQDRHMVQAFL